jgi:ribosomal protein S18 acetylase RimI-like enzyme
VTSTVVSQIGPAVFTDAASLAEFGARTFAETFGADNTAEDLRLHLSSAWSPELQAAEILDPGVDTLLARVAGVLAGFAQLRAGKAPACITTPHPVELLRFYVDKPWQGKGLAGQLMESVLHRARARGGRELWLGVWERNLKAQAFYRRHGFRQVGTQIFIVGNDPQTDHVMLREIP